MLKVLVAEDESVIYSVIERVLSLRGYEVSVRHNGRLALEEWDASFDILITDLEMPELDGLKLIKAIRENSDDRPIILMTGSGLEEAEALALGATVLLHKPFTMLDLVDLIGSLLP